MADALFQFHSAHFEEVRVDRRLARETEPPLNAAEIRVVGQQPRCPGGDFLSFGARVDIASLVFDTATGAIRSAVLRRRVIASPQSRAESSSARRCALAPVAPIGPLAVDRRDRLDRTRRIAGAINLIAIGTDAKSSAEGWLRIAARSSTCLDRQSARLRAGRPGRPFGPSAVSGAIGDFVTVAQTPLTPVRGCRSIAVALAAGTAISLGAFPGVRALRPFAPFSPTTVD